MAIKLLHQSLRNEVVSVSRFFHEARAVNTIRHPNVVEVYDLSGEGEDVYMVLELLRGQGPAHAAGRAGAAAACRAERVVGILEQVCGALQASHARKIVHRDLKPENVFLTNRNGRTDFVKLLDFGVAKLERPEGRLTREGIALGTPEYMAPEQARGADVDARTDVYAVGCIAYEMLTGRTVFHGATPGEMMIKQVREAPRPPRELNPSIPEALEEVVLRCLAKSPKARPQSAMELAQELCTAVGIEFDSQRRLHDLEGLGRPQQHQRGGDAGGHGACPPPLADDRRRAHDGEGTPAGHRAIAGAAVCVALLTWLGLRGGRRPRPPTTPPQMAAVVRPALTPLSAVEVLVRSTPPGAQIFDESGRSLGVTPRTLSLPPGGAQDGALRTPGLPHRSTRKSAPTPRTERSRSSSNRPAARRSDSPAPPRAPAGSSASTSVHRWSCAASCT